MQNHTLILSTAKLPIPKGQLCEQEFRVNFYLP
jgi:hypothetical protein